MVKNFGGNKSKKLGRKHISASNSYANRKLRIKQEEDEIYACVSKIYGNGRCLLRCIDTVERPCVIRNKFRGRGKRDNTIRVGTWILAGVRSWESKTEKKEQTCDLLEVYNDNEVKQLKEKITENWSVFHGLGEVTSEPIGNEEDLGFEISNTNSNVDEELEKEINESLQHRIQEETFGDDDDLNIDDI